MSLALLWVDPSGKPRMRVLSGRLRVGRGPTADIDLDEVSVAPFHAMIDATGTTPFVTSVGPTSVNETPVASRTLRAGDVVRFGSVEATVAETARPADGTTGAKALAAPMVVRGNAPPPGTKVEFPLLRVAAVTLVIFGGAWAINSARTVKWRAPLDPEDAHLAERRARGINKLLGPSAGSGTAVPAAPMASSASGTSAPQAVSTAPAISLAVSGENPVNVALRSVVSITGNVRIDGQSTQVLGSGFFVTTSGLIVTNAHVMDHEGTYLARTHDGRYFNLTERERSREVDLGVFAAAGEGPFPALAFGNAKGMNYGDQVWAIGSPLSPELGFSVTRGVVSSPLRLMKGHAFLQHDAAINPGNSGGPLLDMAGRLVGVNTWKVAGQTQGLGFAIPVEVVEELLKTWKLRP